MSLRYDEYFLPRERFTAADVLRWVASARLTISSTNLREGTRLLDTLGRSPANIVIAGLSSWSNSGPDRVGVVGIGGPISWTTEMSGCYRSESITSAHFFASRPGYPRPGEFLNAMDSAARVAFAWRAQASDLRAEEPFDLSRVS
jgi:hypothetical protein